MLLSALGLASAANAEVSESLEYSYYDVDSAKSRSIVKVMNATSPHRVGDQVVYGMTRYRLSWRYRGLAKPDGSCTISDVQVKLEGNISLPRLVAAKPKHETAFTPFLAGLRVHELGHFAIGQQAAAAVDARMQAVPTMASCDALKVATEAAATGAMAEFHNRGAQYDADTGHGKTQGAWLYE